MLLVGAQGTEEQVHCGPQEVVRKDDAEMGPD